MTAQEYNQCVDSYSDALYRFALKNMHVAEYAKDVVQQAYEVLWVNKTSVTMDKAKSYLFTIAHRRMIDEHRKNAKTILREELPESTRVTHTSVTPDLKRTLHQALEKLSEMQRQMVLLKDYEGYSYQEIAQIMNLTDGQVKINLFRARQSLKESLINMYHHI